LTVDAKHRHLFNADTTTCFVNPERWQPEGGPYTAKAFHRYVDNLADYGIDGDFMFAQIREVVEEYDFAGLELDWLRNALCCEPNATAETVATMTERFRGIRKLTQQRAAQNGKTYPFGMRIPYHLDMLLSIGIDIRALVREGIIDYIAPSCFLFNSWDMPIDALKAELGEALRIYGVVEVAGNLLPAYSPETEQTTDIRYITLSREMVAASAAGKLALGADGIYWFNFYTADQARDPRLPSNYANLRGMERLDLLLAEARARAHRQAALSLRAVHASCCGRRPERARGAAPPSERRL